jgi:hypothetical protein
MQEKEFISVMHTFLACDDLLHRGNFTFQLVVRSESQTRGERHTNHPRVSILAFLSVAVAHLVGAVWAELDEIADVVAPPSRRLEECTGVVIVVRGREVADVISFDGFDESVTVLMDAILHDAV